MAAGLPRKLGPPPKRLPDSFQPTAADARSLYRSLWRLGALSVMFANPGRSVIRQKIREAFEESRECPKTTQEDIVEQWERGKKKEGILSFPLCCCLDIRMTFWPLEDPVADVFDLIIQNFDIRISLEY